MKSRPIWLVCAVAVAAALGWVCVRQHHRLAQAEENPFALQNYDTRIDLAVNADDDMTWVVSSTAASRGYALFVWEFKDYQGIEQRGRPFVYAMRLPVGPSLPGASQEHFKTSVVRLERLRKLVDGREDNVEYRLNGRHVIILEKPIMDRIGMSYGPAKTLLLADGKKETVAYDISNGLDANRQENFRFRWELHICSEQALKRYVDSGELREVWEGNSVCPASRLFKSEK